MEPPTNMLAKDYPGEVSRESPPSPWGDLLELYANPIRARQSFFGYCRGVACSSTPPTAIDGHRRCPELRHLCTVTANWSVQSASRDSTSGSNGSVPGHARAQPSATKRRPRQSPSPLQHRQARSHRLAAQIQATSSRRTVQAHAPELLPAACPLIRVSSSPTSISPVTSSTSIILRN